VASNSKTLELRLNVVSDTRGSSRALQELAAQAEKLDAMESKAMRAAKAGRLGPAIPGGPAAAVGAGNADEAAAMLLPRHLMALTVQIEKLNSLMGKAAEAAKADAAKKEAGGGDKKAKPWDEKKDDKKDDKGVVRDERPGFARYAEAAAKGVGLGDVAGVAKQLAGPALVATALYQAKERGRDCVVAAE
jgi:hypothetical protein